MAVVLPVYVRQMFRCRLDLALQGLSDCRDIIGFFQCLHDRLPVFLLHLPELHRSGALPFSGIRHIKDIAEPGEVAAGIDQSDAFGTALYIAAHPVIP